MKGSGGSKSLPADLQMVYMYLLIPEYWHALFSLPERNSPTKSVSRDAMGIRQRVARREYTSKSAVRTKVDAAYGLLHGNKL